MNEKKVGVIVLLAVLIAAVWFFFYTRSVSGSIPPYIKGEMREVYAWAKTTEGNSILEQVPCFCACKYEGHRHARDCFWRDDGSLDKHGTTCSICFNIGQMAKRMHEEGKDICTIRKDIDAFYAPNKEYGTDTPMPAGCM